VVGSCAGIAAGARGRMDLSRSADGMVGGRPGGAGRGRHRSVGSGPVSDGSSLARVAMDRTRSRRRQPGLPRPSKCVEDAALPARFLTSRETIMQTNPPRAFVALPLLILAAAGCGRQPEPGSGQTRAAVEPSVGRLPECVISQGTV